MFWQRKVIFALRSLLAFALAFVAVWLVNAAGSALATLCGLPPGGDARLAWDFAWLVAAGIGAGATVIGLAPNARLAHLIVFFVVAAAIDTVAIVQLGGDWPLWFKAASLLSLPVQAWCGWRWAVRMRAAGSGVDHVVA